MEDFFVLVLITFEVHVLRSHFLLFCWQHKSKIKFHFLEISAIGQGITAFFFVN